MRLEWDVVLRNLPALWQGLAITVIALVFSLAIGLVLGAAVCALRIGGGTAARRSAILYVTVFRTVPEVVLIFWMYYCLPTLTGFRASGLTTGCFALGLAAGAYLSEIFRAGVESVPPGQWDAAKALALPRRTVWTWVVLPQAARVAIPPFINYFTELVKGTTLLATIGVAELAFVAYTLGARTFRYLEFLTAIALVYFIVIFPIALYAAWVERRLQSAHG